MVEDTRATRATRGDEMTFDYGFVFDDMVTEFKRNLLREQLDKCTEVQQDLFNRMYGSIDAIRDDKMRWAYQQVCRTVADNAKVTR